MSVKFTDNSDKILQEFDRKKAIALRMIGGQVETAAKKLTPVDTGRLRNSITHQEDDDYTYVGTDVEYSIFVERGTRKQKAQPFLAPAVKSVLIQMKDAIRKIFES